MTIEISQTTLYISAAIVLLLLIVSIYYFVNKSQNNKLSHNERSNESSYKTERGKETKKAERAEVKRRAEAAKRIEAEINDELQKQKNLFVHYIANLKYFIKETQKKTFFNLTRYTKTDPSNLFFILSKSFKIPTEDKIYYCRRNSSTFGSDDYFIITDNAFAFGDSNGEKWNLKFEWLSQIEDCGDYVSFGDDDEILDWEYILYYGSLKEKADFIEDTNKFLKSYKTEEDILIDAALSAADEKALSLLSNLKDKLGTASPIKKYISASYYFLCAEDGDNRKNDLERSNNYLQDAINDLKEYSKEDESDVKKYPLYGYCEILKLRILLLNGKEDIEALKQSLKEYMGNDYPKGVRDAAERFYSEIN